MKAKSFIGDEIMAELGAIALVAMLHDQDKGPSGRLLGAWGVTCEYDGLVPFTVALKVSYQRPKSRKPSSRRASTRG